MDIRETVEARKVKIGSDQAWELIQGADEVVVGRGRKYRVFRPAEVEKEEILKLSLGRTGNLRAPTLKLADRVLIGFNDEMYAQYLA